MKRIVERPGALGTSGPRGVKVRSVLSSCFQAASPCALGVVVENSLDVVECFV